jgi:hypothetical protein
METDAGTLSGSISSPVEQAIRLLVDGVYSSVINLPTVAPTWQIADH